MGELLVLLLHSLLQQPDVRLELDAMQGSRISLHGAQRVREEAGFANMARRAKMATEDDEDADDDGARMLVLMMMRVMMLMIALMVQRLCAHGPTHALAWHYMLPMPYCSG